MARRGGDEDGFRLAVNVSGGDCRVGARMTEYKGNALGDEGAGDAGGFGIVAAVVDGFDCEIRARGCIECFGGAACALLNVERSSSIRAGRWTSNCDQRFGGGGRWANR